MKSLPASPVEFRASSSRPPERVWVAEARGAFGTAVIAASSHGLVRLWLDTPLPRFVESLVDDWGATVIMERAIPGDVIQGVEGYLDGDHAPIRATVQPIAQTPFVIAIHDIIARIPWGESLTYGDLAALAGNPLAARAAGGACSRNRVLVVVPCHRVVAANGLGGFGGNLSLKRRLLAHEGVHRWSKPA